MKYISIVFMTLISFSVINAMVPDVTKWQEICKNPEQKQKLVTMYQDFCKKRFKKNIGWTICGWTPLAVVFKNAHRANVLSCSLALLCGGFSTLSLACSCSLRDAANQGNLSYLNRDVLRQLGNPRVKQGQNSFRTMSYVKENNSLELKKDIMIQVDTVEGIEKALSGNYRRSRKHDDKDWNLIYLKTKVQLQSMTQRIKNIVTNKVE